MNSFLTYLFWPNPGNVGYDSPKVLLLLVICAVLVIGSFAFSRWRRSSASPAFRKVSGAWSAGALWFGLIGLVLLVSRVEQIQFLAMRVLWAVWLLALAAFIFWQLRVYRMRYHEVIPMDRTSDPRTAYLPKRKKR